MRNNVRGWKCFNENLQCRGMQFEVGKIYEHEGEVKLCASGFHFHEVGGEIFNYYKNKIETRVCEIIAHEVICEGDKSVCRKIEVVRELNYDEICRLYSSGYGYGFGDGYGNGYGSGYGSGYGNGYGDGDGYGYGYGNGYGSGYGSGYGYGYGSGYGNGYGDGDGYGCGSGSGSGFSSGSGSGYGYGYGSGSYYLKLTHEGKIAI